MRTRSYILMGIIAFLATYSIYNRMEIKSLKKQIIILESEYEQANEELANAEQNLEDAKSEFEDLNNQAQDLQSEVEDLKFHRNIFEIQEAEDAADQLLSDIEDAEDNLDD